MAFRTPTTIAALALAATTLAACDEGMMPFGSRSVETFAPVTSEADFRARVVGREVAYANGATGSYGEDGTWAVTSDTGTLASGTWTWQGDRWCFEGNAAAGPVSGCETVEVSQTGVRFTREDGTMGTLPFSG